MFKVKQLQNWSYKFSTSSKEVGYSIIKGGNIAIPEFNINFLLFGEGGPNSNMELELYLQEKADAWTHIFRDHPRKSYAQALRSPATFSNLGQSNHRSVSEIRNSNSNSSPVRRDPRLEHSRHNQLEGNQQLQTATNGLASRHDPFCVRCLSSGHLRPSCSNRIKCHRCKHWGHIAKDCYSKSTQPMQAQQSPTP